MENTSVNLETLVENLKLEENDTKAEERQIEKKFQEFEIYQDIKEKVFNWLCSNDFDVDSYCSSIYKAESKSGKSFKSGFSVESSYSKSNSKDSENTNVKIIHNSYHRNFDNL